MVKTHLIFVTLLHFIERGYVAFSCQEASVVLLFGSG